MQTSRTFDDPRAARALAAEIASASERIGRPVKFMEVCGTHTMAIAKNGLRAFLPPEVDLVSGPGCPVCVTPDAVIDAAARAALEHDAVVATFGDMVRVPGSRGSLEQARGEGADVRIVYSPLDALAGAMREPDREWIFVGIGFETTAPLVAAVCRKARADRVGNVSVLCAHKTVPPAMLALLADEAVGLDGFLCPGHVSVVIGPEPYRPIAGRGAPCVIAGFEPLDILQSLHMLVRQIAEGRSEVENQYFRAVKPEGNAVARRAMGKRARPPGGFRGPGRGGAFRPLAGRAGRGDGVPLRRRPEGRDPPFRLPPVRYALHARLARGPLHGLQRGILRCCLQVRAHTGAVAGGPARAGQEGFGVPAHPQRNPMPSGWPITSR